MCIYIIYTCHQRHPIVRYHKGPSWPGHVPLIVSLATANWSSAKLSIIHYWQSANLVRAPQRLSKHSLQLQLWGNLLYLLRYHPSLRWCQLQCWTQELDQPWSRSPQNHQSDHLQGNCATVVNRFPTPFLDRINDSCVWGYFVIFGMSCPQIVFRSGLFQNSPPFPVKLNYCPVGDFLRPMKFNNTRRHWMDTPRNSRTHWEEWSEVYECWNESVLEWYVNLESLKLL